MLLEVAEFSFFLDQVQIKVLELPRRCLSAFFFFFLAFWQCQMKKDLTEKEEGENIKEA